MLVTSIFFFSPNVFYLIQNKFCHLMAFKSSSVNAFNLDCSKLLSFSKELNLYLRILNFTIPKEGAFYFLPKDKILVWSKFKAFADNIINVAQKLKFVHKMVENSVWEKVTNIFVCFYNDFKSILTQGC